MDHHDIAEQQLVDRYLLGRLPPEQAAAFEQHYLGCPECLDQLELAEKLQLGFKAAAVQTAVARAGLLATLARALRSPQGAALLAALLVVAVLPIGWLTSRLEQRDGELQTLHGALDDQQEKIRVADRELDALRAEHQSLKTQLARAFAPQENPLVLSLGAERGSDGSAPSFELHLPGAPGWLVLELDFEADGRPPYRAQLLGAEGAVLWASAPFVPDQPDYLRFSFHSSTFAPGDYTVRIEAASADGPALARYRFRVVAASPAGVR